MKHRLLLLAFLSAVLPLHAQVVTNTADSGPGSLRDIIAAASPGATITFTNTLSGQTITLTSGQLLITNNLTIDASALSDGITLSGNDNLRVLFITNSTVQLDSLTIADGAVLETDTPNVGGGIYAQNSDLTVENSTIRDNFAKHGGGVTVANGTNTFINCTVVANQAKPTVPDGGGFLMGGTALLHLIHCTVTENLAGDEGAGLKFNGGTLVLENSIVDENGPSGGADDIARDGSVVATLIGTNFIGQAESGVLPGGAVFLSGNPQLAPLGDYGGPTQTMPPMPGSPVLDAAAITGETPSTDQRGFARIVNSTADIGAVEAGNAIPDFNGIVDSVSDTFDGLESSGVSLREAIAFATNSGTITFATNLSGQTITLTNGQLRIDKNLTVDASAISTITIDGNNSSRLFKFTAGTTSTLTSLTLTNGFATGISPASCGGAIFVNSGADLTINHSTLAGNAATDNGGGINNRGVLTINNSTLSTNTSGGWGGGTENEGGTLALNNSALSGNTATFIGGGIDNTSGTLMVNSSTLTGNEAGTDGGGIFQSSGTLALNHSTLSGNTASDDGGGIYKNTGTLDVTNSIVAGNTAGSSTNIFGSMDSSIGNLIDVAPVLAPLGHYGGPTQTLPPLPGSPAIDAGFDTGSLPSTDQRGFARVVNGTVDIGAVETQQDQAFLRINPFSGQTTLETTEPVTIVAYAMSSPAGALDPSGWISIANSGDADSGGSIDPDDNWTEDPFSGVELLAEEDASGDEGPDDGFLLSPGVPVSLGAAYDPGIFGSGSGDVWMTITTLDGISRYKVPIPVRYQITATTPPLITDLVSLGDGTFQFSFTNNIGASFRVLASTNIALPSTNWTFIGFATEAPPSSGQFQFTDPQATNFTERFYQVNSP